MALLPCRLAWEHPMTAQRYGILRRERFEGKMNVRRGVIVSPKLLQIDVPLITSTAVV